MRVHAYLTEREATLYLDTSGEPLFKRGWRRDADAAPLRENLAAGLLALSGWTPGTPLLDPMCGSGTIAIEAALIAADVAPGLHRTLRLPEARVVRRARVAAASSSARATACGRRRRRAADLRQRRRPARRRELPARTRAAAGVDGWIDVGVADALARPAPCAVGRPRSPIRRTACGWRTRTRWRRCTRSSAMR